MCIQLRSNQILSHPYITLGIIQERREILLTAVYKTVLLISSALIEIEKVSLCHSISLPTQNLKNTKFIVSLSLLGQIFQSNSLIQYLLSTQEGPFFSLKGGVGPCTLMSAAHRETHQEFIPEMENNLLLLRVL